MDRRWRRSATFGGLVGFLPQYWMLTAGTWNPLRWSRHSDFYEGQARAMLHGTLAMDQRLLGIESFARGEQHFMYFGPVPALFRLPIVAFTRTFDGRLAVLSMLAALVVTLVALLHLGWGVRGRVVAAGRLDQAVSRSEAVAVGGLMFSIIGASSLLYAASRTWIYHEAILWGVAFTLCSLATLLAWFDARAEEPVRARRLLVLAGVFALLALLTRPSVAGGAIAALGLVAAREWITMLIARRRTSDTSRVSDTPDGSERSDLATSVILGATVVVPIVVYSIVNWLKFRRLLGVPFDQQGYTLLSAQRQAMLEANGGSLFGADFVPTNLMTYLRPDLIGLDGTFPFVQPRRPITTIGSPFYDLIDSTAGIPSTMPLLFVLALVGIWVLVRQTPRALADLRPIVVGCALGTVAVLGIGYLANRYQSDFLPFVAVAALIGLPSVVGWVQRSGDPWRRRGHTAAMALGGVLLMFGLAANAALGYSYQRAFGPSTPPRAIAGYIDTQRTVDGWFGDGRLDRAERLDALTVSSRVGDVAIIGQCTAMYISDGGAPGDGRLSQWHLAELADDAGASRGTIQIGSDRGSDSGEPLPLLELRTGGVEVTVSITIDSDVMTATAVSTDGAVTSVQVGPDLASPADGALAWESFADTELGQLEIHLDGKFALYVDLPFVAGQRGEIDVIAGSAGVVTRPVGTPVCDRLLDASIAPAVPTDAD